MFKIVSEGSTGANVRRIEAVTSAGAISYVDERLALLDKLAAGLKCRPTDIATRVEQVQRDAREMQKKLQAALSGGSSNKLADAVAGAVDMGAYKFVAARLDGVSGKELRNAWDTVREKLGVACACVLASVGEDGKVALLAAGTDPAVEAGFKAGEVIRQIAPMVGGRGGGRPTMAQAGGRDAGGVDEALKEAKEMLEA